MHRAVRAERRARPSRPAPTLCPTRMAAVMFSDRGSMKTSPAKFMAIWCPATTTLPSGASSRAVTANSETSKNTASAPGRPMRRMRQISGTSKRQGTGSGV